MPHFTPSVLQQDLLTEQYFTENLNELSSFKNLLVQNINSNKTKGILK